MYYTVELLSKDHSVTQYPGPLLLFTFYFILPKTKNNVKNTLCTSIPVRITNNHKFVKGEGRFN